MVQFLQLVHPTATAVRATADVDAALDREVEAAGRDLHEGLMRIGYTAVKGNRYERAQGRLGVVVIDLLVNTMGTQLDACRDLHARAVDLDRRRVRGLPRGANPARTAALIRAHVRNPG